MSQNIKELYRDNKKKGRARGANGKSRSRKQIIAIAYSAARKGRSQSRKNLKRAMFKK